jgi:riboflavin biosynthesis pyrimidine reductase
MTTAIGIPASELTDADLERELVHAHRKRHDTFVDGTANALATHTRRTAELEHEYLRRFPERVVQDEEKRRQA